MASQFHAISVAMEQWTAQHHASIIEAYFKNGDSAIRVQRLFRRHFNIARHGRVPCRNTIKEWVQNLRKNASALKIKPRGRIPMVRIPENVDTVRMVTVKSPRGSVRRHSTAMGLSDRSMWRILHKDLNFHPYKTVIVQELSDRDMANRRIYSEQLVEMLTDDGVISTVLMTHEAHFHLSGYVNKENYRYWATENPQELHQRSLHNERLTVWCGITLFGVPVFEDNEGGAVTVTSKRYVSMLRNFCEPELCRRGIDLSSVWLQQDGATAHTGRASMSVLLEMFPQHVISCRGNVPRPARSLHLSTCDHFLWGYLSSKVFISKPRTIAELKQSIKEETAAIPEQMTRQVMENLGVGLKQF